MNILYKLQTGFKYMRTKDKLVVGFVWGIIIFQTTAFLTLLVPSLYTYNFLVFIILVPIFLTDVTLLIISYYKSTVYPAGSPTFHVNTHYSDELQQIKQRSRRQNQKKKQRRIAKKEKKQRSTLQQIIQQIESLKSVSYCFKCDLIKEQRVHHCSICKKCILRMDHHCPWTGNCIGKLNHKYFILFLFYATAGLFMVAISITIDLLTGGFYESLLETKTQSYIYYFACITSYMLASSIGFLFVTQMLTSMNNLTTLQSFTQGIHQRNPWKSQSSTDNLRDIFGDSVWFLPTQPFQDPHLETSSILNSIDSL